MIDLQLFWTFFKIGAFTFGGGYAMLPLIQIEVANHGWMSAEELVNFVAISESTPGPFAINAATYVGYNLDGVFGSFCATLGVVLPSFIVILMIAKFFSAFQDNFVVKGVMSGLKPAVIGLIGTALLTTGQTVFFPNGLQVVPVEFIVSAVIFGITLFLAVKKYHPIKIILLSAVMGIASGYFIL